MNLKQRDWHNVQEIYATNHSIYYESKYDETESDIKLCTLFISRA